MTKPIVFSYRKYEELREAYKELLQDNQRLMADNRRLRITNDQLMLKLIKEEHQCHK